MNESRKGAVQDELMSLKISMSNRVMKSIGFISACWLFTFPHCRAVLGIRLRSLSASCLLARPLRRFAPAASARSPFPHPYARCALCPKVFLETKSRNLLYRRYNILYTYFIHAFRVRALPFEARAALKPLSDYHMALAVRPCPPGRGRAE